MENSACRQTFPLPNNWAKAKQIFFGHHTRKQRYWLQKQRNNKKQQRNCLLWELWRAGTSCFHIKLSQCNQIMLIISASMSFDSDARACPSEVWEGIHEEFPGLFTFWRGDCPALMNPWSFPAHTQIFPHKCCEIQEGRLETQVQIQVSTAVQEKCSNRWQSTLFKSHKITRSSFQKTDCFPGWVYCCLDVTTKPWCILPMQKKNYNNMIKTERSSVKPRKHWLIFFNLASLNEFWWGFEFLLLWFCF